MNQMSIPYDTPDRERHGWTGDSQLQMEIGLLNLDASNFAASWLSLLRDQMSYSGFITDITPNPSAGPFGTGSGPPDPAWTSALPNIAW
jgi:alpha-L-rhamnosidase